MEYEELLKRQNERAIAWLEKTWTGTRRCPICNDNNWTVGAVTEMRTFQGGDLIIGGGPRSAITPVLHVLCDKCGYTNLFNALKAGVLDMNEWRQLRNEEEHS